MDRSVVTIRNKKKKIHWDFVTHDEQLLFLVFNHNGTFFCCAVASYLYGHIHAFFCVERNKCSSNVRTATGNQSGPHRGRSVQFLTKFFITAPRQRRQHLHLAAPTFCSHYIWIKAIEWIDTSALASGRALKWRRTRLFVYVLREGKHAADRICNCHRWSSEPSPAEKWRKCSAPCGVHPHRAPTDTPVRLYGWLALWHRGQRVPAQSSAIGRDRNRDWTARSLVLMGTMGGAFRWKYGAVSNYWIFPVCDLCSSALWGIATGGQLIKKEDMFWTYFIRQVVRSIQV